MIIAHYNTTVPPYSGKTSSRSKSYCHGNAFGQGLYEYQLIATGDFYPEDTSNGFAMDGICHLCEDCDLF